MLRFSLILATIGREAEVRQFLGSLASQTYRNFELIVVDQNEDDRVRKLVDLFSNQFPIIYLNSTPGLSHARNCGLERVTGDIVAFPDDDCWYEDDLLDTVVKLFDEDSVDIWSGQSCDASGHHSQRRWPARRQLANKINVWGLAISYTVFMRSACARNVGAFDERLGVGARTIWQSGEETDYLIRAMVRGFRLKYDPCIKVFHPQKTLVFDDKTIDRAKAYGAGLGRVLKKHRYPNWFVGYMLLRPCGGIIVSLITLRIRKAYYHYCVLRGRYRGWAL